MKTVVHAKSLQKSGILRAVNAEAGSGKDLLVLPDIPAVRQARKLFASNGNSARFITTFGALAQKHNLAGPDRKQILSRTGRAILMRKALETRFPNGIKTPAGGDMDMAKLGAGLLRLNADLKQSGTSASSVLRRGKQELPPETAAKLSEFEPVLTDFETRMETSGMLDDTGAITELAKAIEKGNADGAIGKVRRIIAAGFHRLTPSHIKVMEAAEKAGIQTLLLVAEPDGGREPRHAEKTKVFLSSFPFISNEAEFAASEIRKMIDGGRKTDDFAVIVRNLSSCGAIIRDAFERNGVPVAIGAGMRLGAASAISVLLKGFLAAARDGKEFIRLLRNPMLKNFFRNAVNISEAVSEMEYKFEKTGLRNQPGGPPFERITEPPQAHGYKNAREKITELKKMISEHLPADGKPVKAGAMFSGLALLVDRTAANKGVFPQDRSLEEAREFLREAAFLSEKWDCETRSAAEFSRFANELLNGRAYSRKTVSDGVCVPVMNALQARGTSYPVVFVLDFSEQSFPQPPSGQTVLNDREKELINRRCGARTLSTDAVHLNDERLIWKAVSVCADEEMHISFSRNGAGGRTNRSHFIEEFGDSFIISEKEEKGSNAPAEEGLVYSPETARAAAFASEGKARKRLEKLLRENDPFFRLANRVGAGVEAEKERLRAQGRFCGFEGIVGKSEDLWWKKLRVSDIEKFGTCPFMFFCSNVLEIRESRESGEIPEPADTGSLYHAALRHFFSSEADAKTRKTGAEETDRTLSEFLEREETKNLHCRVSDEVWELQKERARHTVGRFVRFEKQRILDGNFTPKLFEREIHFNINGSEISGRLDRMDITPGGGARVVDYKKGSVKSNSFCDRENLQIPLYLAQISRELGIAPESGAYLSVERPWETNERTASGAKGIPFDAATGFSRSGIELAKKGFFAPVPVKKPDGFPYETETVLKKTDRPCGFCAYSDICRVKNGVARTAEK